LESGGNFAAGLPEETETGFGFTLEPETTFDFFGDGRLTRTGFFADACAFETVGRDTGETPRALVPPPRAFVFVAAFRLGLGLAGDRLAL
jgi:hypothetical protein